MKRVVLIGDSIRMGYEATVRADLTDEAFVWAPGENGQHSVHLLLNFWSWVVTQQPDVLHLNSGAWETRRVVRGVAGNVVPVDAYRANVARLLDLAREHTQAKIIWATITPQNQATLDVTHRQKGLAGRDANDIAAYNAAAMAEAYARGVIVNDLHDLVVKAGPATMLDADGVHFTSAGYEKLGHAVAATIRPLLKS